MTSNKQREAELELQSEPQCSVVSVDRFLEDAPVQRILDTGGL